MPCAKPSTDRAKLLVSSIPGIGGDSTAACRNVQRATLPVRPVVPPGGAPPTNGPLAPDDDVPDSAWQAGFMSTVPASSNIMLASLMLGFFSICLVLTFQAPSIWWVIPGIFVAVLVVLATIRIRRARRMRQALHGAQL